VIDPAHRLWTLANAVTVGRLVLLIPLFKFLREGNNKWAIAVMCAALLTDMLDGLIARMYHQESDWGKVLDPIADKVWIGCLALFLALPSREPHPLPWPFLIVLFGRYVLVILGVWYAYMRTGVVLGSNWYGKFTMICEVLTLLAYTIYWAEGLYFGLRPEMLLWVTVIMIFVSTISYFMRFRRLLTDFSRTGISDSSTVKVNS
jgi:CDP-diacylglycerol--glycerol-3-phosphate 3-phosphatidyltransferase